MIVKDSLTNYFILLSGLIIVSCVFAYNKGEAWLGIAHLIPFFFLFLSLRTLITNYFHLYYIIFPIIFNSIIICFLGIGEVKFGWQTYDFIYKTLGWRLIAYGTPEGRMSSVFPHANPLSLYLTTALFFTLGLLIDRWKKNKFDQINFFLIFTLFFNSISLILTSSRNGWMITFLGFLAFAIYLQWHFILQLLTMGTIFISWASFGDLPGQSLLRKIIPSFVWARLSDQMYPDRPLSTLRSTQWDFCLDLIKNKPFFGWGLRNFSILYEEKTATYLGHPHNFFLMIGAETGLITLVVMMFIISKILWRGIIILTKFKSEKNKTIILFSYLVIFCGYVIYNLFDVSLFDLRLNILAWVILASISGINNIYNYSFNSNSIEKDNRY
ncbi:O-antigen ligase [Geminocystis sp. NIES-3709]|uniref:O-antigen ligase family protein n=1 Tax=Geminocystis sp. NIES-3709 TaxID=1617448 RepID=UPI0005FC8D75|nr:O-antigen ligase family protein [Geminocystis sp. NIES-3709]BAQ64919.1 lipid A core O-antigen ligase related Slr0728 [Geminocystis sp. NIES-3709]